MTLKSWKRMKNHQTYLLERILELRQEIFFRALKGEVVCETKRNLFIKYNNRLNSLTKYNRDARFWK